MYREVCVSATHPYEIDTSRNNAYCPRFSAVELALTEESAQPNITNNYGLNRSPPSPPPHLCYYFQTYHITPSLCLWLAFILALAFAAGAFVLVFLSFSENPHCPPPLTVMGEESATCLEPLLTMPMRTVTMEAGTLFAPIHSHILQQNRVDQTASTVIISAKSSSASSSSSSSSSSS